MVLNTEKLLNKQDIDLQYEYVSGIPGAEAEEEEKGVVKIVVNGKAVNLKYIEKNAELKKSEQVMWIGKIYHALGKSCITLNNADRAVIAIVFFMPRGGIWDTDNYPVRYIINAIRYNKLVKDDSWKNVVHMVGGARDDLNPRTEIYILYPDVLKGNIWDKIHQIFREAGVFKPV